MSVSQYAPRGEPVFSDCKITDLQDIQKRLKRQFTIEEFQKKEVSQMKELYTEIIFSLRNVFAYYQLANCYKFPIASEILNSFSTEISKPVSDIPQCQPKHIKLLTMFFKFKSSNMDNIVNVITKFAKNHPEQIDPITFSIIPIYFEYFWCDEQQKLFSQFLQKTVEMDFEIGMEFCRIILIIPELSYRIIDLIIKHFPSIMALFNLEEPDNEIKEDEKCLKYVNAMNSYLKTLGCSELLDLNIFKYIISNKSGGYFGSSIRFSQIVDIEVPIQHYCYFTNVELKLIHDIIIPNSVVSDTIRFEYNESDKSTIYVYEYSRNEDKKKDDAFSMNTQYTTRNRTNTISVKTQNPNATKALGAVSSKPLSIFHQSSSVDLNMRKLLIELPLIPDSLILTADTREGESPLVNNDEITSQNDGTIMPLFEQLAKLANPDQQLLVAKHLGSLKQNMKWSPDLFQINNAMASLCEYVEMKEKNSLATVSKIQNVMRLIRFLNKRSKMLLKCQKTSLDNIIIDLWIKDYRNIQHQINNNNKKAFILVFAEILDKFNSWLSSKNYKINIDLDAFHNQAMQALPYKDYVPSPAVQKDDAKIEENLEKYRKRIESELESLTIENQTFSIQLFKSNPKFISKLDELKNEIYSADTPIQIITAFASLFDYINSIFRKLSKILVCQNESKNDGNDDEKIDHDAFVIYEDQLNACLFYIVTTLKTNDNRKLSSRFNYIKKYLFFDSENGEKYTMNLFKDKNVENHMNAQQAYKILGNLLRRILNYI